jgi:hypothetical protein
LERELVFREKDQEEVPTAEKKLPPSTATCTERRATVSEALPEMEAVPERVAPLAGEVILTEGAGVTGVEMLMLRLAEAEWPAESFTNTVKRKEPATDGVPERVPVEERDRLVGKEPLARLQE